MDRIYYTYILQCCDGSFYIGITTDLGRRIQQHNGMLAGGAKYTQRLRPVYLRYYEIYSNRSDALKREYKLKQLTHQKKQLLCDHFTCVISQRN